jgi:protein phosphatase
MGQTWVVVAIVVGIGVALFLFFRNREEMAPPAKAAPSPAKEKDKAANAPEKASPEPPKSKPAAEPPKSKPGADASGPMRAPTVREPAVQRKAAANVVPKLHEDDDDEITIVTLTPRLDLTAALANVDGDDDDQAEPDSERPGAVPIIYDEDAAEDEPTRAHAVILVSAVGQTDLGQKRKINEDRYLVLDEHQLYVVADGMGGHAGGEVASQLAVDTISAAFKESRFEGDPYPNVPRRGGELAMAIQMANRAIFERAKNESKLTGMGTTIVSARFTPGKERVYIGHVGDSRCYRYRAGQLTQVTTDHTMGAIGMTGPFADHLSRAVGIAPAVKVDLVIAKPRHEDVFLLCSDGLSKMVKDDVIREVLSRHQDPNEAVAELVERANKGGGRDNITVILVVVKDPKGFALYMQEQERKRKAAAAAQGVPEGERTAETPAPVHEEQRRTEPGIAPLQEEQRTTLPQPEAAALMLDARAAAAEAAKEAAASTGEVRASASTTGEVRARPSVPPRPSVPEARKSVPEARPSTPDGRRSRTPEPPPQIEVRQTDAPPPDSSEATTERRPSPLEAAEMAAEDASSGPGSKQGRPKKKG